MQGPKLGTLLLSSKVPCTYLMLCKCIFNRGINPRKVRLHNIVKRMFSFCSSRKYNTIVSTHSLTILSPNPGRSPVFPTVYFSQLTHMQTLKHDFPAPVEKTVARFRWCRLYLNILLLLYPL